MDIRPTTPADRPGIQRLLETVENFSSEEVACALEVLDAGLGGSPDYLALSAEDGGAVVGFLIYGPTPMTAGTFDLYWIASSPAARGRGVGSALVEAMEAALRRREARLVRVETSSTEEYLATMGFYRARGYLEQARIPDFYRPGDDLVILVKRL